MSYMLCIRSRIIFFGATIYGMSNSVFEDLGLYCAFTNGTAM